jgi:hypothetical protein
MPAIVIKFSPLVPEFLVGRPHVTRSLIKFHWAVSKLPRFHPTCSLSQTELLTATITAGCANPLFEEWVSRFCVPAVITSDLGAQFTSSLWAALCNLL